MRITFLKITNFRAITHLELSDLRDTVVVAGPNGCGKSCIFDAIKMLKSAYGGYQANEWQSWLSEFQININRKDKDWSVLLQDKTRPLEVLAGIAITDSERAYLSTNAEQLVEAQAWSELNQPHRFSPSYSIAAEGRIRSPLIARAVEKNLPLFVAELKKATFVGKVTIARNGEVSADPSLVLELVFGNYNPQNLGILDFHGPNRNYAREQIASVNLNVEATEARLRDNALYNYANKYTGLKAEMASAYVRQLLARESGQDIPKEDAIFVTVKELFNTFFPGKEFLGPVPKNEGRISFPVRIPSGGDHDIDELSSGEKEILYGYLRIRSSAPRHSVLLIDEPELHLNPRLIKGLATFYHRHLGAALGNQLWLVTHSDALIREAVGRLDFSAYHMQPPGQFNGPNQASVVNAGQDLDRLSSSVFGVFQRADANQELLGT